MISQEPAFADFVQFAARLRGDEKSEAQTFLFHLLESFGHDANTLPVGATFEYRVRFAEEKTKYADFVWPGRCLIEMKSRGGRFAAVDYFSDGLFVPPAPAHVVGKAGVGPRLKATRDYSVCLVQVN